MQREIDRQDEFQSTLSMRRATESIEDLFD